MKPPTWVVAVMIMIACGDGGSSDLELEGKSGDEAARLLATRLCERDARCGHASVSCQGSGQGGGGPAQVSCTGQISMVDAAECFEDAHGDLSEMLACKAITGPEATLLEACFGPLITRACVTQSEVDQLARMAEAGQSPNVNPRPPACQQLFTQLSGRCP